jgi:hypothetical protein
VGTNLIVAVKSRKLVEIYTNPLKKRASTFAEMGLYRKKYSKVPVAENGDLIKALFCDPRAKKI